MTAKDHELEEAAKKHDEEEHEAYFSDEPRCLDPERSFILGAEWQKKREKKDEMSKR
jgi:hypothetical protein